MVPLKVSGITFQSGFFHAAVTRMTAQTARPITGRMSSSRGNRRLATTFDRIAATRIANTMTTRAHSTRTPGGMSLMIGEYRCCWIAAGMPKMKIATAAAT